MRADDVAWKDIKEEDVFPGSLVQKTITQTDFIGAVVKRDFESGEPITSGALVRSGGANAASALLAPGYRAVSVAVDAPQSVSGLALPGDRVDVILIQRFNRDEDSKAGRSVAETVLRDVRVLAVDQSLSPNRAASGQQNPESRIPKTVTFEVRPAEAEALLVAVNLGRIELVVRPLEERDERNSEADFVDRSQSAPRPAWDLDVSAALRREQPITIIKGAREQ